MRPFFFGLGYSSNASVRAIHQLIGPEVAIAGTRRKGDKTPSEPVSTHIFDGTQPGETLQGDLSGATHVINSIGPDAEGDAVLNQHGEDLQRAPDLQWLCYYSTVGVYGNADGAWIDEDAPCHPQNQRSQWRLKTEDLWREFAAKRNIPLAILRLAGIYGPGRSAFDKLRAGTARRIIKPGQVFNRIHVDDIGRITALAAKAKLDGTFNLADDEPAASQDVVTYAAELEGVSPPANVSFADAEMTQMARSFYSDNKRVANARIKKALGVELLYPTYRLGLTSIYGSD